MEDFVGHICIQWRTLKNVQTESTSEHVVTTVTHAENHVPSHKGKGEVTLLRHMRKALYSCRFLVTQSHLVLWLLLHSLPPFTVQVSALYPHTCTFNDPMKYWKETVLSSSKLSLLTKRSLYKGEHVV